MDKDEIQACESALATRTADYVTVASKAVLGAVPFVGSLLAEVAGTIIPNQRIDRIARFAAILEEKIGGLEQGLIRAQLTDENFTDVLEEGIRQAARSTSDERRQYIASIIAAGLTDDNVSFIETKHLLRILNEINDIEVLWLRFYLVPTIGGDIVFREKHKKILDPVIALVRSPRRVIDKAALQDSYKEHLARLSLISPCYRKDLDTGQSSFHGFTGELTISSYRITSLGRLLLAHLNLWSDEGGV